MVTDEPLRWPHDNPDVPKRSGTVPNYENFDPSIFGKFLNFNHRKMIYFHPYP